MKVEDVDKTEISGAVTQLKSPLFLKAVPLSQ